jgi:hypothetical protein
MKTIGVVFSLPTYPNGVLTRIEGASVLKEDFAEIVKRFRKAFPEARWINDTTLGAWLIPASKKGALQIFYLAVGIQVRVEEPDKLQQLSLF